MIFAAKIILLITLMLASLMPKVNADMVYLKNGRSIEGFLVNEDKQGIVLEVGFGTIKIEKNQIVKIDKSPPEESIAINQEWKERKLAADKREAQIRLRKENEQTEAPTSEERYPAVKEEARKESQPQNIEVNQKGRHIFVDAILNNKIHVSLMLDTGASLVVLSKEIGRQLGYLQGTGKQPSDGQPVGFDHLPDFRDYGVGCFLLAGSEVYKLASK